MSELTTEVKGALVRSTCPSCKKITPVVKPNIGEIWHGVCKNCGAKLKVDNSIVPKEQVQIIEPKPDMIPTKSKPEYAPAPIQISARIRCLICRDTATGIPIVLGRADVSLAEKYFFKQIQKRWHGFEIQPERAFLIASIGKWWGVRHEQVQYLMYDVDEGTSMWYMDKKGKRTQRIMHEAKEMVGLFMPSLELGLLVKQEALVSAYKARQQSTKEENQTKGMTLAIVAIACLVIGIFIGFLLHSGTNTAATTTVTKTTTTTIQSVIMLVRNLL